MAEENKPSQEEIDAKDLEERVKGFNAELLPKLGKFKLGLGAVPFFLPDGKVAARPQLFDAKNLKDPKAPPQAPQGELKQPIEPIIPA